MPPVSEPAEFLNRSALRVRGWTPRLVRDLLGEADELVANPRNPAWPPMGLYARTRVLAAEDSRSFRAAREGRRRRPRTAAPRQLNRA